MSKALSEHIESSSQPKLFYLSPSSENTPIFEISSTLSKISKRVRKDQETSKSLDKLEEQLKNGEFHAGRGAKKLAGTQSVYYLRAGNQGRLFFRYSDEEKGAVEIVGESNKDKEQEVIDNLRQNYK
jgi:mRNA-degrading endonuclease RelE of RelBE toxin-antitoxin system